MVERIAPAHDLTSSNPDWRIEGLAFASDGRLYAEVTESSINLWGLVVYYWPEGLGVVAGLLLLVLVLCVLRVRSRPQAVGMPHCARCGYCRKDLDAAVVCPECATDPALRRPVVGRTRRRRLALPVAFFVAGAGTWIGTQSFGVRRVGSVSNWFQWHDQRVDDYATKQNAKWLLNHWRQYRRLIEIDVSRGVLARTVRDIGSFNACPASVGPDGKTAVVSMHRGELAAVELTSGKIVRTLARLDNGTKPSSEYSGASWRHVAGWLDAERVAVQFFDPGAGRQILYTWNIRTGDLAETLEIPCPPGSTVADTFLYMVPGTCPSLALEVIDRRPERAGSQYGSSSTIRVRNLDDGGGSVREMSGPFWAGVAPVFGPGEGTFFIRGWGSHDKSIMLWSHADGTDLGGIPAPGFMGTLQSGPAGLAYHAPTHRLFVATTGGVHVRDTEAKDWIALLDFKPDGLPDDQIAISPDGRTVAIAVTETIGTRGVQTFRVHILIFDISGLQGE